MFKEIEIPVKIEQAKRLDPVKVGDKTVEIMVQRMPRGEHAPHSLRIIAEVDGERREGTMTLSHERPLTEEEFDAALRKRCEELAAETVGHRTNAAHFERLFGGEK